MNDALEASSDRAGALARFVEQIDTDDDATLTQALQDALTFRRSAVRL